MNTPTSRKERYMPDIVKTMKLHINVNDDEKKQLETLTNRYANACTYVSQYIFNNGFPLNSVKVQEANYQDVRTRFQLKSQLTVSVMKTVTARYKTLKEQLAKKPYKYKDENDTWQSIPRTLEWLYKPIVFRRPQADLVRNRDYNFINGKNGTLLSLNTLEKERLHVQFDVPEYFEKYFDGSWKFGTGKLVSVKGEWYFHIPMTKHINEEFSTDCVKHVVGIDRGLRFLLTSYDEKGRTHFVSGKEVMRKRDSFQRVRDELQAKGTRSAKRVLARISGRENRWMTDVNHRLSKALVDEYGAGTLFVLEDLSGVSFSEELLSNRSADGRRALRSWAFYQFEQFLSYKAVVIGASVVKVDPAFTSQRCPKCGRVRKGNRHHDCHEYVCDCCGYSSNDDRVGAMNIYFLGTLFLSGDSNPRFGARRSG